MTVITQTLPPYPSAHARTSLTPSQSIQLNRTISSALHQTLARSPAQLDATNTRRFVSTYARDHAFRTLQSLIWENTERSTADEVTIRKQLFLLSEKLASCPSGIDIQTLLDLSIIYGPTNHSRTRALFSLSFTTTPALLQNVESEILPAFVALLSRDASSGLYELRKTAQCISCFLHTSPTEVVRLFMRPNGFITDLARAYDERLATIAASYGGLHNLQAKESGRILDVWERVWLETKVALMDSFHIIMGQSLNDVLTSSEADLALQSDRLFDLIFGLLDVPSSSAGSQSATNNILPMPFLNRSLLADYQHAYKVSQSLASAFARSAEKDARLDVLEATFQNFDAEVGDSSTNGAGALRPLVSSPVVPPRVGNTPVQIAPKSQASQRVDSEADVKVAQVLDILPDYSPTYIRALLMHPSYPFRGDVEKVVEALLEGTAPSPSEVEEQGLSTDIAEGSHQVEEFMYTKNRKNVFDDDVMDVSRVRFGKKRQDDASIFRDRSFIEEMKADILRRAEALSDDDEEKEPIDPMNGNPVNEKGKGVDIAYDDELEVESLSGVRVVGDGDESAGESDGEDGNEEGGEAQGSGSTHRPTPETILELAYIRDPRLFDRDAQTRRSKPRGELKAQTGWSDEQIEGWKIMLERNPQKERILQKHEFSGNKPWTEADSGGPSSEMGVGRGRDRGRGRGSGGNARGGGGGRGGGRGSGAGNASDRSWKEKNKASRGNHDRKRGHDKKMARGLAP